MPQLVDATVEVHPRRLQVLGYVPELTTTCTYWQINSGSRLVLSNDWAMLPKHLQSALCVITRLVSAKYDTEFCVPRWWDGYLWSWNNIHSPLFRRPVCSTTTSLNASANTIPCFSTWALLLDPKLVVRENKLFRQVLGPYPLASRISKLIFNRKSKRKVLIFFLRQRRLKSESGVWLFGWPAPSAPASRQLRAHWFWIQKMCRFQFRWLTDYKFEKFYVLFIIQSSDDELY